MRAALPNRKGKRVGNKGGTAGKSSRQCAINATTPHPDADLLQAINDNQSSLPIRFVTIWPSM